MLLILLNFILKVYDTPDAQTGVTSTSSPNNVSQSPQQDSIDTITSSTTVRPISIPNNLQQHHSTTTNTQQSSQLPINGTSSSLQTSNNNNNTGPVLSNGRTNNLLNNNQDVVYGGGKSRNYYNGYDDGTNNLSRLAPEGKDAELVKDETRNNNKIGEDPSGIPPAEVFSTSSNENGKINVQVTVLFGK